MRVLALEHGCDLVYDIATEVRGALEHKPDDPLARHDLELTSGTRLASILGDPVEPVNTHHHQAVASAGEGLIVAARAPDGVVEAIEDPDHRFAIGLQWHPEQLHGAASHSLFRALVQACR